MKLATWFFAYDSKEDTLVITGDGIKNIEKDIIEKAFICDVSFKLSFVETKLVTLPLSGIIRDG